MYCTNCGKEIPNGAAFCPECGEAQNAPLPKQEFAQEDPQGYTHVQNPKEVNTYVLENQVKSLGNNTMCMVGLIVSIISLLLNPFALVGIAAIIISVVGLVQISKNPENGKAKGVIGIVLGAFSTIYFIIQIMSIASYVSYY